MQSAFPRLFRILIRTCAIVGLLAATSLAATPRAGAQLFYFSNGGDETVRSMNADAQSTILADFHYPTSYGSYASSFGGMAFDPAGNLFFGAEFVTNQGNNAGYIIKITPAGVQSTYMSFGEGVPPVALAFDHAGDLYMTSTASGGSIIKTTLKGVSSTFATNLGTLQAGCMTVDASNNVYVTGYGNNEVYKISPVGTVSTIASLVEPDGISLDSSGNLFVTDGNIDDPRYLTEIAPDGTQTTLASNIDNAGTDYVDPSGNVFISNSQYVGSIYEYASGAVSNFATDLSFPADLTAPSPANTIYLSLQMTPGVGGVPITGTVTLSEPATATAHVRLSSSDAGVATVRAEVTIKVGQQSATFPIATTPSTTEGSSTIAATTGGKSSSALVVVLPCTVASLSFKPASVTGGSSSTGTVRLNGPAPSGGATVALSCDSNYVAYPTSVVIPAGQQTGTFTVTTKAVVNPIKNKFTAKYNSQVFKHAVLTITPPQTSDSQEFR